MKNKKFVTNMAKIVIVISIVVCLALIATTFTGCEYTEADIVNTNISKQAGYFECCRRITVLNARSDEIMFRIEGYMNISNNMNDELVVTVKTGEDTYKVNYIYLNEWTLYVVEDITGTVTDPYHYKVYFHSEFPFDAEVKP